MEAHNQQIAVIDNSYSVNTLSASQSINEKPGQGKEIPASKDSKLVSKTGKVDSEVRQKQIRQGDKSEQALSQIQASKVVTRCTIGICSCYSVVIIKPSAKKTSNSNRYPV